VRNVVLAFSLLGVFFFGCSKDDSQAKQSIDSVKIKKKVYSAKMGVWRGLKKMEACMNLRSYSGYKSLFAGKAYEVISAKGVEAKFLKSLHGKYSLKSYKIGKRYNKKMVGVEYIMNNSLPNKKGSTKKDRAIFVFDPQKDYWVIISF